MDLGTYLTKHNISQEDFAASIGVTQGAVWQWINGKTRIDPKNAKVVVKRTRGKVTFNELPVFERAAA